MKTALITGITGQDGSYLSEFLLEKGYEVHGIIRRSSTINTTRIDHLYKDPHVEGRRFILHYGDMTDGTGLRRILHKVNPDEVYNLAAQSHVRISFDQPEYTADVVGLGALRMLEALRDYQGVSGNTVRIYQASSSEMFGSTPPPQNEKTIFHPRSPYAASKVAAYHYAVNYREAFGMFISTGILFNHESPRRGETFVTRKITRAMTRIKLGLQEKLFLGNLSATRDWGFAGDYVKAMWKMLQIDQPDDFVISTGETHSVQEFLEDVAKHLGMDWKSVVEIDPRYFRPTEVDALLGDSSKAARMLSWKPEITFKQLVKMMTDADMELAKDELTIQRSRIGQLP